MGAWTRFLLASMAGFSPRARPLALIASGRCEIHRRPSIGARDRDCPTRVLGSSGFLLSPSGRPAPTMLRRHIDAADLNTLGKSIKRNGIAQPLLARVTPALPGMLELIAGYRRWRAALVANVAYVPVIVFPNIGDAVALELGLLENLHRRDLTILEEAEALRALTDQYGRTHGQIAAARPRLDSQFLNLTHAT